MTVIFGNYVIMYPGYQMFFSRCSAEDTSGEKEKNCKDGLWRLKTGNRAWKASGTQGNHYVRTRMTDDNNLVVLNSFKGRLKILENAW